MFTGLVESLGKIVRVEPRGGDVRLWVHMGGLDLSAVVLGDSICVSGVCLTVVEKRSDQCAFDVSNETLRCSALAGVSQGAAVNLETSLTLAKPLGGHLVSGHVDGVGTVAAMKEESRSWCITLQAPADLVKYLAPKGSVTLDGISLTVNEVSGQTFTVNIIPHTFGATTVQHWVAGGPINIEVDVIARYVEALLKGGVRPGAAGSEGGQTASPQSGVSLDLLAKSGFLK